MGTLRQRLGRNLRRLRVARGLTQEALGGRADTDPKYLGAVERGQVNIGLDKIELLADALGVDVSELLEAEAAQGDRTLGRNLDRADVLFRQAPPQGRRLMLALLETVVRAGTGSSRAARKTTGQ